MFLRILGFLCLICVSSVSDSGMKEAKVDMLETEFLGGNKKFVKTISFFKRRYSHGLNLLFNGLILICWQCVFE